MPTKISWADRIKCFFKHKWHRLYNDGRSVVDYICLRCGKGKPDSTDGRTSLE